MSAQLFVGISLVSVCCGQGRVLDGLPLEPLAGGSSATGSSATFEGEIRPFGAGVRSAVIVIMYDDLPENPFVFRMEGVGN
ncbi:MAG: hypothetical protein IPM36_04580 [Lewinellaceae bacterium]|nr:hypothetical protein [Lewinellaceae bacterium]